MNIINSMQKYKGNRQDFIKKLCIVVIVFAAISIAVSIISFIVLGISFGSANNPETVKHISKDVVLDPYTYGNGQETTIWSTNYSTKALLTNGLIALLILSVVNFLACIYTLVCAIITKIHINKAKKQNSLFVICTIACITSFFSTHIIESVLLIIITVNIYKIMPGNKLHIKKHLNNIKEKTENKLNIDFNPPAGKHSTNSIKKKNTKTINANYVFFKTYSEIPKDNQEFEIKNAKHVKK